MGVERANPTGNGVGARLRAASNGRLLAASNGGSRAASNRVIARRPHVLQVFQPTTGGVPKYAANLAHGLRAAGWQVTVACPADACVLDDLEAAGVDILPLRAERAPNPWHDARAMQKIAHWCRARGVSLLHGHSTKAGLLVALAGRMAGVPSIYTPHTWAFQIEDVPLPLRAAYALAERRLARRHAQVMTVSEAERTAAERWRVAPRGEIRVIRTGLPPLPTIGRSEARRLLRLDRDRVVAAWVGRVGHQSRAGDLVPIARAVDGRVTIVALCAGVHGTRLADELRAAGVVVLDQGRSPATVYAAADMVLHTSQSESSPLVVLEAMSAGLPVVGYFVGGVPEQVRAGRTGYVVERGDIEMMCECVAALAGNSDVRARMGDAARRRATGVFDFDTMLDEIIDVYVEVAYRDARVTGATAPGYAELGGLPASDRGRDRLPTPDAAARDA